MNIAHIILMVSFGLLLSCSEYSAEVTPEVSDLLESTSADDEISVIIRFQETANVASPVVTASPGKSLRAVKRTQTVQALREMSSDSQKDVLAHLHKILSQEQLQNIKQLWIINAISVTLPASVVEELSHNHDVKKISLDAIITPDASNEVPPATPEWNLTAIGADTLWDLGYIGQNVVIGTMDTGIDALHQDLASRWRGGDNSWFDPFGEHSTPYDKNGHGTQTMGVAVGGDTGGTSIGVAPGAKWISVKIFNDAGTGSISALHQGFQWMLDPDNNPETDDAPDVVNNSWNFQGTVDTCSTEFQTDIDMLRKADIAVVFSAGNTGPAASTSISPANNAGSLSTGSVDESLNVVYSSGRGPSACNGGIYPLVSAPGFNIRTADLTFGGAIPNSYTNVTGTSFAVAHVAGAFALLKSAFISATVDEIESALIQSATDAGASGSDNDYGWGVINIANAYLLLQAPAVELVATDDYYTVIEGESLLIGAPGVLSNDSGSVSFTAVIADPVSNGSVDLLTDGSFSYAPNTGFSGMDSYTYVASDGQSTSNVATVFIDVIPANALPVANNDSATTVRRKPVVINLLLNDTDIDSVLNVTSIEIVTQPMRGILAVNNDGTVTYTSRRSSSGTDTFSYQMYDAVGALSNVADVTVDILRR